MALFTIEQLRNRVSQENISTPLGRAYESLEQKSKNILNKALNEQKLFSEGGEVSEEKMWDIFLSHSSHDATIVSGLKLELEDMGYDVYVDWIEDPQLNRARITKRTAETLKRRMNNCESLFYAYSVNASASKWMPWELGYFDGKKNKAAILPITESKTVKHAGVEFLGVYPYITKEQSEENKEYLLWVNEASDIYVRYDTWLHDDILPHKH